MTQTQFGRILALSDKMEAAATAAGRTWTDTADLPPPSRAEWRRLMDIHQDEWQSPQQCPDSYLGGADDGRIGIVSDAAW